MFSWDIALGWCQRYETREISRRGRQEIAWARQEAAWARAEIAIREEEERKALRTTAAQFQSPSGTGSGNDNITSTDDEITSTVDSTSASSPHPSCPSNLTLVVFLPENWGYQTPLTNRQLELSVAMLAPRADQPQNGPPSAGEVIKQDDQQALDTLDCHNAAPQGIADIASSNETVKQVFGHVDSSCPSQVQLDVKSSEEDEEKRSLSERISSDIKCQPTDVRPTTLTTLIEDAYRWLQETFPTATAAIQHLPFALVPFALSMFVLVQALANKGWIRVFAHGWDIWVTKTGTVGSIVGMGSLSVILCSMSIYTWMTY